jgi:hypothetical protein
MPGLVDVIALRETIDIRGVKITVRGLSITTIGRCLAESENLQRFWAQRKFDGAALLASLPRTIARVVATSIIDGPPAPLSGFAEGDGPLDPLAVLQQSETDRERAIGLNMGAFDELIAEDQLSLVEAVIRVSFPGGLSPFVERVRKMAGLEPKATEGILDRLTRFGRAQVGTSPPA